MQQYERLLERAVEVKDNKKRGGEIPEIVSLKEDKKNSWKTHKDAFRIAVDRTKKADPSAAEELEAVRARPRRGRGGRGVREGKGSRQRLVSPASEALFAGVLSSLCLRAAFMGRDLSVGAWFRPLGGAQEFLRLQERYRKCSDDFKELNLKANLDEKHREELFAGASGGGAFVVDLDSAGNDEVLGATKRVAERTTKRLEDGLRTIVEAKDTADAVNEELAANTRKLEEATNTLSEINSELDIANRHLTRFMKNLYTDKLIIGFVFLIVMAIVGIIVYSMVKPNQDTFNVPDEVKPPVPSSVTGN